MQSGNRATARLAYEKRKDTSLVALTSRPSEAGAGVSVTQFWKRGAVDYKRVPALNGVDLEAYRKESRMEVRISAE